MRQNTNLSDEAEKSAAVRQDWSGWAKTGCSLFLRPNYMLQGNSLPVFYTRVLADDVKHAFANSMKGVDFDGLTTHFATQEPTLNTLAAVLNHPDASVDVVMDDYCSAFGPAKSADKEYFDHWEAVYSECTPSRISMIIAAKRKYGADDGWWSFYVTWDDKMWGNDGDGTIYGIHANDLGTYRMAEVLAPVVKGALVASAIAR